MLPKEHQFNYYAANANAPVVASAAPPNLVEIVQTPSSKHWKAIILPVVKRFVAASAGVKTNCPSPATDLSKATSAAALDSINEPVAQASVPLALKVKVAVPPAALPAAISGLICL